MFEKLWDIFPKPRPMDFREAIHRIRISFDRIINEGVGMLLLGALLGTACAVAGRAYYSVAGAHDAHVEDYLSALLGSEQEPRKGNRHFGLIAAVMAKINSGQPVECPSDPEKCSTINLAHRVFGTLASAAMTNNPIQKSDLSREIGLDGDLRLKLEANWMDEAIQTINRVRTSLQSGNIERLAAPPRDTYRSPFEAARGAPGCKVTGRSTLIVSSLTPSKVDNGERVYDREASEEIALSELLEEVARFFLETGENAAAAAFIQSYFVSPQNVFRIWRTGNRRHGECHEYPASRRWSTASYFEHFLTQPSPGLDYRSRAYTDLADQGFVRTRCTPIAVPANSFLEDRRGQVAGVFCTDHSVSEREVDDSICDNPLLETRRISLPESGNRLRKDDVWIFDCKGDSNNSLSETYKEFVFNGFKDFLKRRGPEELKRSVNSIEVEGRVAYVFPLESKEQRLSAILVRPQRPTMPGAAAMLAVIAIVSGVMALGALVLAIQLSRKAEQVSEKIALLRNVASGVIVVDSEDVVTEANDRAEELLGVPIPKVGVGATDLEGRKRCFDQLIEGWVVEVIEGGRLRHEMTPYSEIPAKRRQGRPSTYYARLAGKPMWVRVSGTPMIEEDTTGSPRTFGVIDFVAEPVVDVLDRMRERHMPSRR